MNAPPICIMLSRCLPVIFSAPLKATWKLNNSVTLLVHLVNVFHLFCPVNQSAPGRADNVRKGTKTFSHCCVFLDFNEKDFFSFLCLTVYQMLLCLSHMLAFKFQSGCDTTCSNSVTLSCARHLSDRLRDHVLKTV